jgi:hypothetical protein
MEHQEAARILLLVVVPRICDSFLRSIVVDKESEHVNDGVLVKPGGGAGIHRLIPQDANWPNLCELLVSRTISPTTDTNHPAGQRTLLELARKPRRLWQ